MNTLLRVLSSWRPGVGEVIHIHVFKSKLQYSVSLKIRHDDEVIVLGFYIDIDTLLNSVLEIHDTLNLELEKNIDSRINHKIRIFE